MKPRFAIRPLRQPTGTTKDNYVISFYGNACGRIYYLGGKWQISLNFNGLLPHELHILNEQIKYLTNNSLEV